MDRTELVAALRKILEPAMRERGSAKAARTAGHGGLAQAGSLAKLSAVSTEDAVNRRRAAIETLLPT